MSKKSVELLLALKELDWNSYIEICDALTSIDRENIDLELGNHSTIYSYYHGLLMEAKSNLKESIFTLEKFEATQAQVTRSNNTTGKKLTDKAVTLAVMGTSKWDELNKVIHVWQKKFDLLKSLVSALESKKDLLVQISSNKRAETKLYT